MNEYEELTGLASPPDRQIAGAEFSALELSNYTLTIGQASSLMHAQRCKFASSRKVQRMCKDGAIDCHKLSTTRNGQPVSEWLVNETSLLRRIEESEIKLDENTAVPPVATGNASHTPNQFGDANHKSADRKSTEKSPSALAMPNHAGIACGDARVPDGEEFHRDVMAAPNEIGAATDEEVGEKRTLASVLIENAKLTGELNGALNLIEEVRDDKEFLRDELREARAGRKDVTAIAQRMLETLESIAVGGKLIRSPQRDVENAHQPPTAMKNQETPEPGSGDNQTRMVDTFRI